MGITTALVVLIDRGLLPFCVGIMFQDITTLLLDPKAFRDTIDLFVERYKDQGITVVAGNIYLRRSFISGHQLYDLSIEKKIRIGSNEMVSLICSVVLIFSFLVPCENRCRS